MNRERTTEIKGIAILMMLFLHLFDKTDYFSLYHPLVEIGEAPLAFILARAMNPVNIFLIVGGYGLYKVWEKGDTHRWSRLLKLFIHYWVITAVFVAIGHFINPELYPGSTLSILENFSAINPTYTYVMWFLMPYAVISALSAPIFRFYKRFNAITILIVTFIINTILTRYYESPSLESIFAFRPAIILYESGMFLFKITFGAMLARETYIEKIASFMNGFKCRNLTYFAAIAALVVIQVIAPITSIYCLLFTILLALIPIGKAASAILRPLGRASMDIWFIHSWLCFNLFKNFIYSFRYPPLIFIALLLISYLSALLIEYILRPIDTRLRGRIQI